MTATVAVLGTGLMGSGMARSLARAGFRVSAWNRTQAKARALEADGVVVAQEPQDAVRDADVIVTMLFDGAAVEEVMQRTLESVARRAVWAQCATIGLEPIGRLSALAERHGVLFVDAPVLGTREPAEKGELIVLAGGPQGAREQVTPVFDAIGSRTVWVGDEPGGGQRLKLAANAWLLSVTAAAAQSVGLADRLGIDPGMFLDAIAGGPLDCAYAQLKGRAMAELDFTPSFSLAGAVKDATLVEHVMRESGGDEELISALRRCFESAASNGDARNEDVAAVIRTFA